MVSIKNLNTPKVKVLALTVLKFIFKLGLVDFEEGSATCRIEISLS